MDKKLENLTTLLRQCPPATKEALDRLSEALGPKAPPDYLDYLAASDGSPYGAVGDSQATLDMYPIEQVFVRHQEMEEFPAQIWEIGTDGGGGMLILDLRKKPTFYLGQWGYEIEGEKLGGSFTAALTKLAKLHPKPKKLKGKPLPELTPDAPPPNEILRIELPCPTFYSFRGPPLFSLLGDRLYYVFLNDLIALEIPSGRELFREPNCSDRLRGVAYDGTLLFDGDQALECRDPATGKLLKQLPEMDTLRSLSADRRLACGNQGASPWTVCVLDLATSKVLYSRSSTHDWTFPELSPDGKLIAIHLESPDGRQVVIHDLATGEPICTIPNDNAVGFSADSKLWLAVEGTLGDLRVQAYDAQTAEPRWSLAGFKKHPNIVYLPGEQNFLTLLAGKATLCDLATGERIKDLFKDKNPYLSGCDTQPLIATYDLPEDGGDTVLIRVWRVA